MKISEAGIVDDGKSLRRLKYNDKFQQIDKVAELCGIQRNNLNYRVNKFIDGKCTYRDIFSRKNGKFPKVYTVGGEDITFRDIMALIGCEKATAHSRIRKWTNGTITSAELKSPLKCGGYNKKTKSDSIYNTPAERNKLSRIPSAGSWEEDNLKPGRFVNSDCVTRNY